MVKHYPRHVAPLAISSRGALTLLEVVVVIAIVGVLMALLIPAIQRVRENASRTECTNNVKQLLLTLHDIGSRDRGRLPNLPKDPAKITENVFFQVTEALKLESVLHIDNYRKLPNVPAIKLYTCPSDFSLSQPGDPDIRFACSYALNAQVFFGSPSLVHTFRDGTSNTIMMAEHYAYKCGAGQASSGWTFCWLSVRFDPSDMRGPTSRATFADGGNLKVQVNDVAPVTQGNPPITRGMKRKLTGDKSWVEVPMAFQDRPTIKDCRPDLPQTPHRGMVSGFGDGSVRTLAADISPARFWSAVTPAGADEPIGE
ncbi:MAG: DUF1559 domain-containing protein [Gemmataceae bacterium]|nr:DUF1559 domain-containing protein [Gemmataceae bacterium]